MAQSTPIWHREWHLHELQEITNNTLVTHLGIEFTEIRARSLHARLLVSTHTTQRLGFLHGGASLALAETVGSLASQMCVDERALACVGLDINANHVRGVSKGEYLLATAEPIHLGRSTHVWSVRIDTTNEELVCIARLTTSVISRTPRP